MNAVQQTIIAPIVNREACNAAAVHAGRILEGMICAGSIPVTAPASGVCAVSFNETRIRKSHLINCIAFVMYIG